MTKELQKWMSCVSAQNVFKRKGAKPILQVTVSHTCNEIAEGLNDMVYKKRPSSIQPLGRDKNVGNKPWSKAVLNMVRKGIETIR